jgi:hypothetical protein
MRQRRPSGLNLSNGPDAIGNEQVTGGLNAPPRPSRQDTHLTTKQPIPVNEPAKTEVELAHQLCRITWHPRWHLVSTLAR